MLLFRGNIVGFLQTETRVFIERVARVTHLPPPPRRHSLFNVVVDRCLLSAMSPGLCQSPRVIASVSSHFNHICHQIRLSGTAPPFTPGSACFCVHASTYVAHKNTLVECIDLYSFFFLSLLSVLDPTLTYYSCELLYKLLEQIKL